VSGIALALLSSCDKDNNDSNLNSTDQTFMNQAAISNKAEIMAGQLAATKGNSAAVRSFGEWMVTEHGMAQSDLQALASSLGKNLPDTVDAQHQALMARLNSLSGYSFDTAYINSQVMDQRR
jgi:putative membrane protein